MEQLKIIHIVKLIPDMKLKEECAKILAKKDAKLEDIEKKVAAFENAKNLAARMSGNNDAVQDKAAATFNKWKKGNQGDKPSAPTSYCNRCNSSGHRAHECQSSKSMVCSDCKGTRHRNKFSGYCSWNSANITIPVEERTQDTPKIRQPTQQAAGGGQQSGGSKFVENVQKLWIW